MTVLVAIATPWPTRTKQKTSVGVACSGEFNPKPLNFLAKSCILRLQSGIPASPGVVHCIKANERL